MTKKTSEPPAWLDALTTRACLVDPDGLIVAANEAWMQFGIEAGAEPSAIGPGADYRSGLGDSYLGRKAREQLDQALAGDRTRPVLEYPCHAPDASSWFATWAAPVDHDGRRCALVQHLDITDYRSALLRAARAEADAVDVGVERVGHVTIDLESGRVVLDEAAGELLQQLPGIGPPRDLAIPAVGEPNLRHQRCETLLASFGDLERGPRTHSIDTGTGTRVLLTHAAPVHNEHTLLGVTVCVTDITDRRQRREHLERLEHVAEHTTNLVVVTDARRRIIYANRAFARRTGRSASDLVGCSAGLMQNARTDPATVARIRSCLEAGVPFRGDILNEDHEGNEFWLDLEILPVRNEAGDVIEFQSTGVDVTEQRALTAQLRAAERFEAIGRVAGGVAHDVNNLLTAVHACASLLERAVGDNPTAHALLDELRGVAEQGADVTQQLLRVGVAREGDARWLDIAQTTSTCLPVLHRLLPNAIELEHSLTGESNLRVRMREGSLIQILMNLVTNARDALGSRAGTVHIALEESGDEVHLHVFDTGGGFPDAVLRRAAEPFFTTRSHGTGIGLSTVRSLVDEAGGQLRLANRLDGLGAHVAVTLPARHAECVRAS